MLSRMEEKRPRTCLIADDSRVVRKLARLLLENLDFECSEVDDGQQAFDACLKSLPDVVLLDWNMPVMDGIEFTRKLRALPGGAAPKIIFCTVFNDTPHIEEALAAGADEYIMKPFDNDIVISKFQQAGAL